ncbi:hypothetical protein E1A91_A04G188000v1 [Gossypium mustelinum]|uniref:Uncharacterized protein n=1 Tax=Gossypium mustelinum TaxID=34275 RepID=A0A5D2ZSS0_GOSMU|nr:hypothetical protein E1A91_A04G188000v1 [Gossypium mustelinum]
MFYHKVIGVTTFYLFVEGHAASPNVSRVLESIPAFIIASTAKRKSYFTGTGNMLFGVIKTLG